MLLAKVTRKTTSQPFTHNGKTFGYGSLFVPVQNQEMSTEEIYQYLSTIIPSIILTLLQ
jgi:hypothetical protein